ncbi:MAG: Gfo/Idh/MocA family oxidoreductase [Alphaproteobacteria bacterium]|nr:Gfo/Idh/MocA family oxidoreductase [Alphaproteobacteria bacterium]
MKFSIFGAGRMGVIHAGNLSMSGRAQLAWVVDSDLERAKGLASLYGAVATSDPSAALSDSSVDAVIIASPTTTHADLIEASVKAGKSILCEKPIDLDIERVLACEAAIAGYGKPVMIGFQRRFDETHMAVGNAVVRGDIGKVESVSIVSRDPSPPPYDYIRTSGGQFLDQMIHDFDLALWLSGARGKARVFAMGAALVDPGIGGIGDTDSAHALIEFSTGSFCKIECSRRASYGYDQRVEVFGERGMVCSDNVHTSSISSWTAEGTATRATLKPDFMQRYLPCYATELTAFIDAVETGVLRGPDFTAGRRAVQLASAAKQSMLCRQPVEIDLG